MVSCGFDFRVVNGGVLVWFGLGGGICVWCCLA